MVSEKHEVGNRDVHHEVQIEEDVPQETEDFVSSIEEWWAN